MLEQYRETYKKINKFNKNSELIFPLTNRGFFSEINNLALVVLYCLDKKINLKLYSKNWVSGSWKNYFNPIFKEYNGIIPLPSDIFVIRRIESFYLIYHKYLKKRKIIQGGIWSDMTSKSFTDKHFNIPELGINGGIFEAKRQILKIILDFNKKTAEEVFFLKDNELNFVRESCGIHVRRGDKVKGKSKEAEAFEIEEYINKARQINPKIRKFTICTDDFCVIESFKNKFPEFDFLSFCSPTRLGYFQKEYNALKKDNEKRKEVINILRDTNLLINAEIFIGAYSSNISRYVTLIRNNENCHSLDREWTP